MLSQILSDKTQDCGTVYGFLITDILLRYPNMSHIAAIEKTANSTDKIVRCKKYGHSHRNT